MFNTDILENIAYIYTQIHNPANPVITPISLMNIAHVIFTHLIKITLRYGSPEAEASRERVEEVARQAQIHESIIAMQKGYDTVVGERGVKLSGGHRN